MICTREITATDGILIEGVLDAEVFEELAQREVKRGARRLRFCGRGLEWQVNHPDHVFDQVIAKIAKSASTQFWKRLPFALERKQIRGADDEAHISAMIEQHKLGVVETVFFGARVLHQWRMPCDMLIRSWKLCREATGLQISRADLTEKNGDARKQR